MLAPLNSTLPLVTPPLGAQQVGDRLEGRALARTVGAQQRDDLALGTCGGTPLSTRITWS